MIAALTAGARSLSALTRIAVSILCRAASMRIVVAMLTSVSFSSYLVIGVAATHTLHRLRLIATLNDLYLARVQLTECVLVQRLAALPWGIVENGSSEILERNQALRRPEGLRELHKVEPKGRSSCLVSHAVVQIEPVDVHDEALLRRAWLRTRHVLRL